MRIGSPDAGFREWIGLGSVIGMDDVVTTGFAWDGRLHLMGVDD